MDLRRMVGRPERPRRLATYLLGFVAIAAAYVLGYQVGMAVFEGRAVTFPEAVLVVVETFTTTGYGEQAHLWTTWQMRLLMVAMQLSGIALVFLALPLLVAPWIEERISTAAPTSLSAEDHVVVCGYSSRAQTLIDELSANDHEHVVVEPDRDRAADLRKDGIRVVHADPETEDGLRAVDTDDARALVADVDDETNASIALAARDLDGVPIITFTENPELAEYHRYAGATEVFSPRQLIGESLARKVTAGVTRELGDAVEIDEDFDIVELPIQSGSELAGKTVSDSGIRERTGANIVGMWSGGDFLSPPPRDAVIDEQSMLVVAGRERQLERMKRLTLSERRGYGGGRVIVAGYGEVGSTVDEAVSDAGFRTVVVDSEDKPGVDVVGDVTDRETLEAAGIDEARAVILALGDDTDEVFATLVVRETAPDVEIIARADAKESVRKLYQAGADYVLALATVSGRMLASTVLEEEVISFDNQIELVRVDAGALAGRSLGEADVRARTGCTVLAVERDDDAITDLGPEFVVERGDDLVVAGTDEDINRFSARFET